MRQLILLLGLGMLCILPGAASASEDRRELPMSIMGQSRHYFAYAFEKTYGDDAQGTRYVACTSTDEFVGLGDFYLFRPGGTAAPVLVTYHRDADDIGNYGTVFRHDGRIDMWPGSGAIGTAESQRIVAEPLLSEATLPAGNVADVFKAKPGKKCAFAASEYFKRPAMPAR